MSATHSRSITAVAALAAALVAVVLTIAVIGPRVAHSTTRVVHVPAPSPVPASLIAMAKTVPGGMAELVSLMKQLVIVLAPNSPLGKQAATSQHRSELQAKVCRATVKHDTSGWEVAAPASASPATRSGLVLTYDLPSHATELGLLPDYDQAARGKPYENPASSRARATAYLAMAKRQAGC